MGYHLFIARSVLALGLGRPIHHCQRMNLRRGPVTNQRHALGGFHMMWNCHAKGDLSKNKSQVKSSAARNKVMWSHIGTCKVMWHSVVYLQRFHSLTEVEEYSIKSHVIIYSVVYSSSSESPSVSPSSSFPHILDVNRQVNKLQFVEVHWNSNIRWSFWAQKFLILVTSSQVLSSHHTHARSNSYHNTWPSPSCNEWPPPSLNRWPPLSMKGILPCVR